MKPILVLVWEPPLEAFLAMPGQGLALELPLALWEAL